MREVGAFAFPGFSPVPFSAIHSATGAGHAAAFLPQTDLLPLVQGSAGHLPWDIGVFLGRGACTARSPGLLLC